MRVGVESGVKVAVSVDEKGLRTSKGVEGAIDTRVVESGVMDEGVA